jgi:uncharacterized LabA/DUF88 family protein
VWKSSAPLFLLSKRIEKVSQSKPNVERVYAAVDVSNLWHSSREQFGINARVDFDKLRDLILGNNLARIPRQARLVAYTITASTRIRASGKLRYVDKNKNSRFLSTLEKLGFEVRNRNMHAEKGIKKAYHTDWDVGIAVDAIKLIDTYDTFTLVSGDGDYSILVEELREKGKFVEVITVESTTSRILHATANRVMYITEDQLYFQEPSRGKRRPKD